VERGEGFLPSGCQPTKSNIAYQCARSGFYSCGEVIRLPSAWRNGAGGFFCLGSGL